MMPDTWKGREVQKYQMQETTKIPICLLCACESWNCWIKCVRKQYVNTDVNEYLYGKGRYILTYENTYPAIYMHMNMCIYVICVIYLTIYISVYPPISLTICLFVCSYIYLSNCLPIHLSIIFTISLSLYQSIYGQREAIREKHKQTTTNWQK